MIFLGACALIFLLIVLPVRFLTTDQAKTEAMTVYAFTAFLLCVIPATATLFWCFKAQESSPQHLLLAVLGGTGIRMFFVLIAAFSLRQSVAYFKNYGTLYWIWILAFYFITLALEISFVLMTQPKKNGLSHKN